MDEVSVTQTQRGKVSRSSKKECGREGPRGAGQQMTTVTSRMCVEVANAG